ncbi:hypothetical protein FQN57_000650 [Myotisia sp. PD_48]|nr:hypothetical protein FQN57_000650 [Myotisia sp. PD_48]
MSSDLPDPFLQVQGEILSALSTTRPLFSSYQRIRSIATSPSNPELIQAREELETTLNELTTDLSDLIESVHAIEHDPYRYGLELDEVERRRRLVEDVGNEIEGMRQELQKTVKTSQVGGGSDAKTGNAGLPHPSAFDNLLEEEDGERRDDYYAEMEHQRQLEVMQEQDQQLDGVFRTVGNLRQQADDMGRELEDQSEMLKDVDTLADRVGGKLQSGMKRVGHIIKRNEDTMSSCCIAVLIMVLILLLVLVLIL